MGTDAVLIKVNTREFMSSAPMGLLYVGGNLRKHGYKVKVFHVCDEEVARYPEMIVEEDPYFIGFSVFTADNLRAAAQLSREIKRLTDTPILWGGVHPSLLPHQCLGESYIDLVAVGEGEETAVELAGAIEAGKRLDSIKGLGYKDGARIRVNEPRPLISNLDDYRMDWELVNVESYLTDYPDRRGIPFVSSRGCPYNCTFCYNLVFNRRRWRGHSPEFVISEVEQLKSKYGVGSIRFFDDNFFADRKRAYKIVQGIGIPWAAEVRIDAIDGDFIEQVKKTDCRELSIGMESGSDRVLGSINKGITRSDTLETVKALSKGLPETAIEASFIFALPTETEEEFQMTLDLILELFEVHPRVYFTTGFYLPYPGTDLYNLAVEKGFSPPARTEDWDALDRWGSMMGLLVDWIDSKETAKLRRYIRMLGILYRWRLFYGIDLRLPRRMLRYRIRKRMYALDIDYHILNLLRSRRLGLSKLVKSMTGKGPIKEDGTSS